jgi:diguanylate cyclase (GGDEF)-like protein
LTITLIFIKMPKLVKLTLVTLSSIFFIVVNLILKISFHEFILIYVVCISASIILIFLRKEVLFIQSLKKTFVILEKNRLIDPLTGLLNREGFKKEMLKASTNNKEFVIAYAGLDKFRDINGTLGHSSGDFVLKTISQRIKETLKDHKGIARLGGDHFSFIIINNKRNAIKICRDLMLNINKPILIGDSEFHVSASIGICNFPEQATGIEDLLDKADMAMYVAKQSHTRSPIFFSQDMDLRKSQHTFYSDQSITMDEISRNCYAVFQPLVCRKKNKVISFEALLRHPKHSVVEIINWAEEYGYMNEIFQIMVKNSARMINESGLPVSVNISPSQISFNGKLLISFLKKIISEYNIPMYHLNLEITESVPIIKRDVFLDVITDIKRLGVKLYLDDFGSGYSFFSTLNLGVFDVIKIDRSLVENIQHSQSNQRLLTLIVNYTKNIGISIVAEGVEDKDEINILDEIGINYFQGYFFSMPLREKEAIDYIKTKLNPPWFARHFVVENGLTVPHPSRRSCPKV